MARISGVDLPVATHIHIALRHLLFGIGATRAVEIPEKANILPRQEGPGPQRVRHPPHPRGDRRRGLLKVEGDLRREVQLNIKRLMDLGATAGSATAARRSAGSGRTPTRAPARARKGFWLWRAPRAGEETV